MPKVACVRLTYNPKVLWFDPAGVEFREGDALIVRTERGHEYGIADCDVREVTQEDIAGLKCALKPVVRKATAEDVNTWFDMQAKAAEALPVFKRMVAEQNLDMHPVTVEFLFDGDKAVFYFEAEERVDFRELVRALAAQFHVRIDMRQIGVRDEARIVGGFGHCGQELCCKRLGGEFNPVSIRMAKDQDLSLNPQKISGVCGRLMCCLRYEADVYKEFKCHCPKMNSLVSTPVGDAKVIEINVPRETVTILAGDKRVKIPVADMGVDKKTGKPNSVPADVYDEAVNANNQAMPTVESLVSPIFTGTDKLADKPQARRGSSSRKPRGNAAGASVRGSEQQENEKKQSRSRRRSGRGRGAQDASSQQAQPQQRTRQQSQGAQKKTESAAGQQRRQGGQGQNQGQGKQQRQRSGARPGQNSSSLSNAARKRGSAPKAEVRQHSAEQRVAPQGSSAPNEHRKSRRRSHKAQGSDAS